MTVPRVGRRHVSGIRRTIFVALVVGLGCGGCSIGFFAPLRQIVP